jgi:hypothetical protein
LKVHIFYPWISHDFFPWWSSSFFPGGKRFFQEHKSLAEQADAAASAARGTAKALGLPAHEQATGADRTCGAVRRRPCFWSIQWLIGFMKLYGYGSIPINIIFRGMNIHLPAILMFTRGSRFWHTAICLGYA